MTTASVTIRPATISDATAIHAMVRGIAAHLGHEESAKSTVDDIVRHGFGETPDFDVLIAEAGGEAVGMCLFFRSFSTWRGTRGGYIQDLYVAPQARRGGVAQCLLAATAAAVQGWGGTYLRLSVGADNVSAQDFYSRQGMTWSAGERIFALDGMAFHEQAGARREA